MISQSLNKLRKINEIIFQHVLRRRKHLWVYRKMQSFASERQSTDIFKRQARQEKWWVVFPLRRKKNTLKTFPVFKVSRTFFLVKK